MNEFISKIVIFIFGNNPHICTIIMSMLPVIEVRGTIPFSLSYEIWSTPLSEIESIIFCFLGSTVATALLLYFVPKLLNSIKETKLYSALENKLKRATKQSVKLNKLSNVKKYVYLSIFTFIPLPLTGYYTSSIIATTTNMKFLPSLLSISLGNLGCVLLITFLSDLLNRYMLIIFYLFIAILILYIIYVFIKLIKNKKNA